MLLSNNNEALDAFLSREGGCDTPLKTLALPLTLHKYVKSPKLTAENDLSR